MLHMMDKRKNLSNNKSIFFVVFVSVLISYIFSTAMYGPRLKIALSVIKLISAQLWMLISVLLIGILLICIVQSYLSNIEKQRERVNG
jgi:hypothetical protein